MTLECQWGPVLNWGNIKINVGIKFTSNNISWLYNIILWPLESKTFAWVNSVNGHASMFLQDSVQADVS